MHLTFRNICSGFCSLVRKIQDGTLETEKSGSRNGGVIRCKEPILLTFTHPLERCLFNSSRDVNPFSVLYESLWALSGRNDVGSISYYTKRMIDYSDDGVTWHGAYGSRWRNHFGRDQIEDAVQQLKQSKDSRRVLLEMWDARVDGVGSGKDYPCNTHVYLSIRDGRLDLYVCNRSNDLVWGLFGTNYVLFSFLLEYLSARIGVAVGEYHHYSIDLHVYENNWKPEEWLATENAWGYSHYFEKPADIKLVPLIKNPKMFDDEMPLVVDHHQKTQNKALGDYLSEPFLRDVAEPMFMAFHYHKERKYKKSQEWAEKVQADDWRIVAQEWLERRERKWKEKQDGSA